MTEPDDLPEYWLFAPQLFIGVLSCVTSQTAQFNVRSAGSGTGTHFKGGRYGRGEVGEYVLIEGQVCHLLGRIVELRLPERDRKALNPGEGRSEQVDAIGTVQLLGSVSVAPLKVTAGISAYPRLGDRIYSAPHGLLALLPRLMEPEGAAEPKVTLTLGKIDVAKESAVSVKPEKLFGRHCAILGATGGGKSWTTARLIEECLKFDCKVVLLDATGEYRRLDRDGVSHCHLGQPLKPAPKSESSQLPPSCFLESDLAAMFDPAGKLQGPKLREAMRSLRLATIRPELATNGLILKVGKNLAAILEAERDPSIAAQLDDPSMTFDVGQLPAQIREECIQPPEPSRNGVLEQFAFSQCFGLITRMHCVMKSAAFACVFRGTGSALDDRLSAFKTSSQNSTCEKLLRVDLSGVSHEFKAREIIANVIGRKLLTLARDGKFKSSPLLVILDEAHHFLGRHIGSEDTIAKLDAFELIAKEGRKYGLTICLATQRPRDITEGVLSQMGTLIVHRLTNDRDREVVERASGEIDRSAASFLPTLKPGEAAIIGADFPIPLTVQVDPPTVTPESDGPDYQKQWKSTPAKPT